MTKGLYVEVDDQVTGYCPACANNDLKFVPTKISGNQSNVTYGFVLRCSHQDVCMMRRKFMEEDE